MTASPDRYCPTCLRKLTFAEWIGGLCSGCGFLIEKKRAS